jgi:CheY-like chemotaxis protein
MKDYFNKKIIVVEDSEFSRLILKSHLKKIGYLNVDLPGGSVEAWELIATAHLEGNPYDLVITDLNMPELDGIDLIEKIKEDPISCDQDIMVITADADPVIKSAVLKMGALKYLIKPVSRDQLNTCLEEIFDSIAQKKSA